MALYLLFESVSGYSLFHAHGLYEIGQDTEAVRNSIPDLEQFGKIVKLAAFHPFSSALDALNQTNSIYEGLMTNELRSFLEINLPREKDIFSLGVAKPKTGFHIFEVTNIPCQSNEFVLELLSGVRLHFDRFIKDLKPVDLKKARLELDSMVVQAIFLLDNSEKDINRFSKQIREWYNCHFPELLSIVKDKFLYAEVAKFVGNKSEISEDHIPGLAGILGDEGKAKKIVEAAIASKGLDLSPISLINVKEFGQKVMNLSAYTKNLHEHLVTKMNDIAPNLSSLIGEVVGARLISHAGSLSNLAKLPSCIVMFALISALKNRGNIPKFALILRYAISGRAYAGKKGRTSLARFIANKCSLAARVDCFSETSTTVFGEKLRKQVVERLDLYNKRVAARKKADAMKTAEENTQNKVPPEEGHDEHESKMDREGEAAEVSDKKMKKKKKKSKGESMDGGPTTADATDAAGGVFC